MFLVIILSECCHFLILIFFHLHNFLKYNKINLLLSLVNWTYLKTYQETCNLINNCYYIFL